MERSVILTDGPSLRVPVGELGETEETEGSAPCSAKMLKSFRKERSKNWNADISCRFYGRREEPFRGLKAQRPSWV